MDKMIYKTLFITLENNKYNLIFFNLFFVNNKILLIFIIFSTIM